MGLQRRSESLLFAALLSASLLSYCTTQGPGACPELPVLSYSSLIYNGTIDVTANQPSYAAGDVVEYRCAIGYQLYTATGTLLDQPVTVCQSSSGWTVENVSCIAFDCSSPPSVPNGRVEQTTTTFGSQATYSCDSGYSLRGANTVFCSLSGWSSGPQCDKNPVLSDQQIIIIVAAVLGSLCLIFSVIVVMLCCRVWKLQLKLTGANLAEDEVAFARERGAFSLSSPVIGLKNEDAAGNPLYLTPDEMTDFEQKH